MTWFFDLKTSLKMVLVFGTLLAFALAIAWQGHTALGAAKERQSATVSVDLRATHLTDALALDRARIAMAARDAVIETDAARIAADLEEELAREIELRSELDQLDKLTTDEPSRRALDEVRQALPGWNALDQQLVAARGDGPALIAAMRALASTSTFIDERMSTVLRSSEARAHERAQTSDAFFGRIQFVTAALVGVMTLLAAVFTLLMNRALAAPLEKAVEVLERVAQGDLTARLDVASNDEVGRLAAALNASLESIRGTLTGVRTISAEVSSASAELAASAQQLSSGAQEQAASLEETAASLEEISSTVKQNTRNAQQASQLSSGARDAAERGGRVVEQAVAAMSEITRSSKKIAEIITTIDEIAFQTNLLALNAAVEAARAGEQGRGFGVVAAEVRLLAQRTGTAAKEIRVLIADSGSKVEIGTHEVNQSGATLVEIVHSVKRVTDMVAEIAAASREQSTGVEQVNTAVTEVDRVTQRNAAQTEELSATASSLSSKAADMREQIARFDLGIADAVVRAAPLAAPPASGAVSRLRLVAAARPTASPRLRAAANYEEF